MRGANNRSVLPLIRMIDAVLQSATGAHRDIAGGRRCEAALSFAHMNRGHARIGAPPLPRGAGLRPSLLAQIFRSWPGSDRHRSGPVLLGLIVPGGHDSPSEVARGRRFHESGLCARSKGRMGASAGDGVRA
jgi:hypothetical protein